ncbi:MAG: PBP1A family penicillin-binding protein [Alphaproteobacteria bacterium]|nr:PBP1A family penicillin-binding protein [Alphaproteobacteria bacterium]MBU2083816.1 PBP1A family penicillin-binding protein [Alphaproteobacteria bacterium]MBU2141754.1 PBP1A family penicillin-binding protein [Alphaproteobacteria bacterium]MBU2197108.1 PBP1A family penicillin-binding protein [Alphaproteobacteria bacterium]
MARSPDPNGPRTIKVPRRPIFTLPTTVRGWIILVVAGILLAVGGFAFYKWQSLYFGMPKLPDTAELWEVHREPSMEFVDRDGNTLAVRGPRYGRATNVAALPAYVPQAFIAAEDKRFYEHDGADDAAIARAAFSNLRAGETVSGASTITQQLIKNLVLDNRQTLKRKAQEMKLARELEKQLSKDEILSLYLNRVYFGAGLYGIDAAARNYFGKPPEKLEIQEAALLATLPKAPSKLNLRENLAGARERQRYVLSEMLDQGFITKEQAAKAREADVKIIDAPTYDTQMGYVIDASAERVKAMLPKLPGDLVVTVSIDTKMQESIEKLLITRMAKDGKAQGASQVGALVMGKDGRVIAMVGGTDYATSEFNRVTQAKRQPGSSFKPFVYAAALEDGFSPYDVMVDKPVTIDKWQPTNYGGGYLGPMTLSEALTRSTNTVAAQLAQESSEERVISLAKRFGITSDMEPFPSIALGSQAVNMWELVRAFGAFQSGGLRMDPYLIDKIEDSRGMVLYQRPEYERERVYPYDLAEDMNAMMARVVNAPIGTGGRARIKNWTVAGKTGTSQDWRDAWFVGFTAAYVGAVWVGNDDDSPMKRVSGGGLPADLWSDMMEVVHVGSPPESLIGAESGLVIGEAAEQRISFYRGLSQAFSVAASNRAAGVSAPQ